MTPIELVLAKVPEAKRSGEGYKAKCRSHDDRNPSLSIWEREDGSVGIQCKAGCEDERVLADLGLLKADLQPEGGRTCNGGREIVATYDYRDEEGHLLFQVVRYEPKDFRQRKPKPGGGWDWSNKGARSIPYRLPELLAAEPTELVVVVEGEKDADNLAKIGFVATTNAGGAEKWTVAHAAFLKGLPVAILGDDDAPGRRHVARVASTLHGVAKSVKVVDWGSQA